MLTFLAFIVAVHNGAMMVNNWYNDKPNQAILNLVIIFLCLLAVVGDQ